MKITLDLDGVLGNFVNAAAKLLNFHPGLVKRWDFYEDVGTTKDAFWAAIHAQGAKFWDDIEPYPWCFALYRICRGVSPTIVLTSPSDHESSPQGKVLWLKKHLYLKPNQYLLGAAKEFCAHPETVLIDDSDANCEKFREHGENAILFPQPWNENRQYAADNMSYTLEKLAELEANLKCR